MIGRNVLEEDIDMTIHLLGKRLCANFEGFSNGVAQPLSFPCKITKEKTKFIKQIENQNAIDSDNVSPLTVTPPTKVTIGTISANPLPSFKFLEVDLAKKAKTKGISMQVMDNIVDFFEVCPEDPNYKIFQDSEVKMIDSYLATTEESHKIYKLSNKAKYFNLIPH